MLNIKPRTQQVKRAMPRSYLKAVKKEDVNPTKSNLLNKRRMKAYREALSMLDKIRQTAEDQVEINGSSLRDKAESYSPENTIERKETKNDEEPKIQNEDIHGLTGRSEK